MIKDNQKNFSRLHMLIDVFVIAASYALAWLIRFQGIFEHSAVQSKTVQEYMFMLIFIIPGYVLLYQAFDLYTPMRMQGRRLVLAGIVKANALGLLIIMFALYNFKEILSLKLSRSDKVFYQDLINEIDADTRKMEYSFEEELLEMKKQSKIYQEKLDHLLDDRKKILKELK